MGGKMHDVSSNLGGVDDDVAGGGDDEEEVGEVDHPGLAQRDWGAFQCLHHANQCHHHHHLRCVDQW